VAGHWFASSFGAGEFVAPLDAGGTTVGIYKHDAEALWLLGVASRDVDGPGGQTLIVYDAPVAVYRFPLEPGREWVSVGTTTHAMVAGLPYAGRDTYTVKVDGAGTLHLPDLSFTQAMRVRMLITISPAVGAAVQRRQVSFVSECFGEIARATSRNSESEEDFTTAAEVRRLGLEGS
jgi:hypothetical protein